MDEPLNGTPYEMDLPGQPSPYGSPEAGILEGMFGQRRAELGRPGLGGEKAGELQKARHDLCNRVGNHTRPAPELGRLFQSEPRICRTLRGKRVRVVALDASGNAEAGAAQTGLMGMIGLGGAQVLEDETLHVAVELTESRILISSLSQEPVTAESDWNGAEVKMSPVPQARAVTQLKAGFAMRFKMMNYPLNHIFTVQCGRYQGAEATTVASVHVRTAAVVTLVVLAVLLAGGASGYGAAEGVTAAIIAGVALLVVLCGAAALVHFCCRRFDESVLPVVEIDETQLQISAVDPSRQRPVQVTVFLEPSPEGSEVLQDAVDFTEAAVQAVGEEIATHVTVSQLAPVRRRKVTKPSPEL